MSAPSATRSRSDLGRANRRVVLGEIVFGGALSRTTIAERTGLTGASVSRITRDLLDAGLIVERPRETTGAGPGRRFIDLAVNARGGYVLGIGLNLFQQSVTLADLNNQLIHRVDLGLPSVHDPEAVIGRIVEVAKNVIGRLGGDRARLLGGAIAITGAVDPDRGVVLQSPTLGWQNIDIGGRLATALDLPMIVESLPNSLVVAESRFGIARAFKHVMLFNCALGLGAGLYADGRLVRGRNFTAGLIARLPTNDTDYPGLSLDETTAGCGVLRRLDVSPDPDGKRLTGDLEAKQLLEVLRRGADGDEKCTAAIAAAGRTLGAAMQQFAGLMSPEMIILSGPVAQSTTFVAGVEAATAGLFQHGIAKIPFMVSTMSPQASARWLAIGEFLVNRDLDLDALRMKEAS